MAEGSSIELEPAAEHEDFLVFYSVLIQYPSP